MRAADVVGDGVGAEVVGVGPGVVAVRVGWWCAAGLAGVLSSLPTWTMKNTTTEITTSVPMIDRINVLRLRVAARCRRRAS